MRLTVRDVAFARQTITALTKHGMTPGRIVALANQATRRGPLLKPAEVQKVLAPTLLVCARTDRRKAIRSINYGLPLVNIARRAGLRRDFRKLAARVQQWTTNGHLDKGGA
jgi:hypothetical protein